MLSDGLMGRIIQCHIDHGDPESFVVGRLVYNNSEWFLMQDLSPTGHWNGLALYMQSDIVSIADSTEYLDRIKTLIKYRNEPEPVVPPISNNPLISLLCYGKDSMRIVGVELYASGYRDVVGTINCLTNRVLCINQIDEFGHPDGRSYLSTEAITRCYIDDEDLRCLEILRKQVQM